MHRAGDPNIAKNSLVLTGLEEVVKKSRKKLEKQRMHCKGISRGSEVIFLDGTGQFSRETRVTHGQDTTGGR